MENKENKPKEENKQFKQLIEDLKKAQIQQDTNKEKQIREKLKDYVLND